MTTESSPSGGRGGGGGRRHGHAFFLTELVVFGALLVGLQFGWSLVGKWLDVSRPAALAGAAALFLLPIALVVLLNVWDNRRWRRWHWEKDHRACPKCGTDREEIASCPPSSPWAACARCNPGKSSRRNPEAGFMSLGASLLAVTAMVLVACIVSIIVVKVLKLPDWTYWVVPGFLAGVPLLIHIYILVAVQVTTIKAKRRLREVPCPACGVRLGEGARLRSRDPNIWAKCGACGVETDFLWSTLEPRPKRE